MCSYLRKHIHLNKLSSVEEHFGFHSRSAGQQAGRLLQERRRPVRIERAHVVHQADARHVQQMRPGQLVQPLDGAAVRRHIGGQPQPGDAHRRDDGMRQQRTIRVEQIAGGRGERGDQVGSAGVTARVPIEQTVDGLCGSVCVCVGLWASGDF